MAVSFWASNRRVQPWIWWLGRGGRVVVVVTCRRGGGAMVMPLHSRASSVLFKYININFINLKEKKRGVLGEFRGCGGSGNLPSLVAGGFPTAGPAVSLDMANAGGELTLQVPVLHVFSLFSPRRPRRHRLSLLPSVVSSRHSRRRLVTWHTCRCPASVSPCRQFSYWLNG